MPVYGWTLCALREPLASPHGRPCIWRAAMARTRPRRAARVVRPRREEERGRLKRVLLSHRGDRHPHGTCASRKERLGKGLRPPEGWGEGFSIPADGPRLRLCGEGGAGPQDYPLGARGGAAWLFWCEKEAEPPAFSPREGRGGGHSSPLGGSARPLGCCSERERKGRGHKAPQREEGAGPRLLLSEWGRGRMTSQGRRGGAAGSPE